MAQLDPVQVAFDSAIRDFRDKLQNDDLYRDIVRVKSIGEVYDATDKLQQEQGKKGHLRHLSKIATYLNRINDYKSAIDIFIQVKPDILGLIWGPIVLLLQWASILNTSFDAILNTIQEIGQALPDFERAARLFDQNKLIKDVLLSFFKDILEFYLVAFNFFRLPRLKYVFEALWPRHRDKIRVVIKRIDSYNLLLRKEVQFEHIQEQHDATLRSLKHFEKTEKDHQLQEYHGIRTELSPVKYDDKLDLFRGRSCSGTGEWLLNDQTFTQWLNVSDVSLRLIWIQGIPGADQAGKIPKSRTLFAFVSHIYAPSALSILHSLIFQLTSSDEVLQTVLCGASRENFKSNFNVALEIFSTLLLACSGPVFVVIDGLDEMDKTERSRLVTGLINTQAKCEQVRICFSSRLEDDLKVLLEKDAALVRVDNHNIESIYEYVRQWSEEWFLEHRVRPRDQDEMRKWLAPLPSRSHGMFLYTKVVLISLRNMTDWDEIRNALTVLPETLDDARIRYTRILSQINRHPARKEKARKLLGWIACSPTPLTVWEVQCGLSIKADDREGPMRQIALLNIENLCGPIVEVVDDYVQFVHFTVKEYITSPSIDGHIDIIDSTLSLTMSCITFLCQKHHDPQLPTDIIRENVLNATYVLHEYAAINWLGLVEKCVSLDPAGTAAPDLIRLLNEVSTERKNVTYIAHNEEVEKLTMHAFKKFEPDLFEMLSKVAFFRDLCLNSPRPSNEEDLWLLVVANAHKIVVIALDPLTVTQTSVLIEKAINDLICRNQTIHGNNCYCDQIRDYSGDRLFKCHFSHCHFRRQGFARMGDLKSHEKYHDRPWKCDVSTCEYANGGFLSRRMRDEHFEKAHQGQSSDAVLPLSQTDRDDLKSMVIDLLLNTDAENVDSIKSTVKLANLKDYEEDAIFPQIAARGSIYQLRLAKELFEPSDDAVCEAITPAIEAKNDGCFELLIKLWVQRRSRPWSRNTLTGIFIRVLHSNSIDMCKLFEKYATEDIEICMAKGVAKDKIAFSYMGRAVLSATTGNFQREQLFLNFINGNDMIKAMSKLNLGMTLVNVARSCCSVRLATLLIEAGVNVDYRGSGLYMTPLHQAARKTSVEAAHFMKLLLQHGADTELKAGRSRTQIHEEEGPKGISKWLGISWNELIEQTKKERDDMQAKQMSSPH
ncbi:hypothetical protein CJF32_00003003 [Rutstroemia sp. NJR-2017a WRK4]|nr:hypothetical protein CJF32_00003003 [Rutstroemia sp. NJR-2017a WRK4]